MKYFLGKFATNWADEMDIQGFMLFDEKEKKEALDIIKEEFAEGGQIGFGTNEYNQYGSLEEIMNEISFTEITKKQHDFLVENLGISYGHPGPLWM